LFSNKTFHFVSASEKQTLFSERKAKNAEFKQTMQHTNKECNTVRKNASWTCLMKNANENEEFCQCRTSEMEVN
jgi:hypothetical protein